MSTTLKKIGTSWGTAKQTMKERIGKVDATTESPEMKDKTRRLGDNKVHLREVLKMLQRETKTTTQALEEGKMVCQALSDWSVRLKANRESGKLNSCIRQTRETTLQYLELSQNLNNHKVNQICQPVKEWIGTEIRDARMAKKKYDKVRVAYDAALAGLKSAESKTNINEVKMAEAKQLVDERREIFESIGLETVEIIETTNARTECFILENLCQFVEAYHEFFKNGYDMLSQIMPDLKEYRETIKEIEKDSAAKRISRAAQKAALVNKSHQQPQQVEHEEQDEETRLFGIELHELLEREKTQVPLVIQHCAKNLLDNALDVEGLFRISGAQGEITTIIRELNKGKPINMSTASSSHVVCGILKSFLRQLPAPLLTYELYQRFMDVAAEEGTMAAKAGKLKEVIAELPETNKPLLNLLIYIMAQVAEHSATNLMSPGNLAVVMAPNIIYSRQLDPAKMMEEISLTNQVVEIMVNNYTALFPDGPPPFTIDNPPGSPAASNDASSHSSESTATDTHAPVSDTPLTDSSGGKKKSLSSRNSSWIAPANVKAKTGDAGSDPRKPASPAPEAAASPSPTSPSPSPTSPAKNRKSYMIRPNKDLPPLPPGTKPAHDTGGGGGSTIVPAEPSTPTTPTPTSTSTPSAATNGGSDSKQQQPKESTAKPATRPAAATTGGWSKARPRKEEGGNNAGGGSPAASSGSSITMGGITIDFGDT